MILKKIYTLSKINFQKIINRRIFKIIRKRMINLIKYKIILTKKFNLKIKFSYNKISLIHKKNNIL